jgi:formamidopyrimidine-DNA glycosylase
VIKSAKVLETKRADKSIEKVRSQKIAQAWRRAKAIIIELGPEKYPQYLLVRLGMTGHFHYASRGESLGKDENYAVVKFFLQDGSILSYTDIRKFGSVRLLNEPQLRRKLAGFGPEPLDEKFTVERFRTLLSQKKKANIKVTLMDQNFLAGLGNIYAQEALYRAAVNPQRKMGTLKEPEIRQLHKALQQVLRQSIAHNGTTVENYVHIEGAGGFQKYLAVYGKDKCPRKHALTKIRQGGRGTYYCPKCQK